MRRFASGIRAAWRNTFKAGDRVSITLAAMVLCIIVSVTRHKVDPKFSASSRKFDAAGVSRKILSPQLCKRCNNSSFPLQQYWHTLTNYWGAALETPTPQSAEWRSGCNANMTWIEMVVRKGLIRLARFSTHFHGAPHRKLSVITCDMHSTLRSALMIYIFRELNRSTLLYVVHRSKMLVKTVKASSLPGVESPPAKTLVAHVVKRRCPLRAPTHFVSFHAMLPLQLQRFEVLKSRLPPLCRAHPLQASFKSVQSHAPWVASSYSTYPGRLSLCRLNPFVSCRLRALSQLWWVQKWNIKLQRKHK